MTHAILHPERQCDLAAISSLQQQAFADPSCALARLIEALRLQGALSVSLVAHAEGRVVGHIACSPVLLPQAEGRWHLLGPLAVLPAYRHRGIGAALVRSSLAALRAQDAAGCVVQGDRAWFGELGFQPAPQLSGLPDFGGAGAILLCPLATQPVSPCGPVRVHELLCSNVRNISHSLQ